MIHPERSESPLLNLDYMVTGVGSCHSTRINEK